MLPTFVKERPMLQFALVLSLIVLLISPLSTATGLNRFLVGHDFRTLQVLEAEAVLMVIVVLCGIFSVLTFDEKRWRPHQLALLLIGVVTIWRLAVMDRLFNAFLGP